MTINGPEFAVFCVAFVICALGVAHAFWRLGFDQGVEAMRTIYRNKLEELERRQETKE
jgi:mannose/fructose/N-acetylgalactosamine-specific phosphotransferase system component IID